MDDAGLRVGLLALSGASMFMGKREMSQQRDLETAKMKLESENAKLQAAEQGLMAAKNFRQALSSQLAISSLRGGGGGSIVRQFAAQSISNMLQDQGVIQRRQRFIDQATNISLENTRKTARARNFSSIGGLLGAGLQTLNLSGSGGGKDNDIGPSGGIE